MVDRADSFSRVRSVFWCCNFGDEVCCEGEFKILHAHSTCVLSFKVYLSLETNDIYLRSFLQDLSISTTEKRHRLYLLVACRQQKREKQTQENYGGERLHCEKQLGFKCSVY